MIFQKDFHHGFPNFAENAKKSPHLKKTKNYKDAIQSNEYFIVILKF